MGYQSTAILIFGVRIDHEQAKTLCEQFDEDYPLKNNSLAESDTGVGATDITEEGLWEIFREDMVARYGHRQIFDIQLRSEGTDSRIESNHLEDDDDNPNDYCFGVYCGSKGYAYNDKIEEIMLNVPEKAKQNWNAFCQNYFPDKEPKMLICQQVW